MPEIRISRSRRGRGPATPGRALWAELPDARTLPLDPSLAILPGRAIFSVMASRDDIPAPDSPLLTEALRLLRKQKDADEDTAVYDMLVGELSASIEIEQMANYLIAFHGAAAVVVLTNFEELQVIFGLLSVTLALVAMALAGTAGLVIRWLGLRIRAFLRISKARREAAIADRQTRKQPIELLPALLSNDLPDDEAAALEVMKSHFSSVTVDYEAAFLKFQERYRSTLTPFERWRELRRAAAPLDWDSHILDLVRRQHWQRRLIVVQGCLTVGLVLGAGLILGVGLMR